MPDQDRSPAVETRVSLDGIEIGNIERIDISVIVPVEDSGRGPGITAEVARILTGPIPDRPPIRTGSVEIESDGFVLRARAEVSAYRENLIPKDPACGGWRVREWLMFQVIGKAWTAIEGRRGE